MNESHYALGEIDRRVGNIMRWGTISAVDAANAVATVDIGDLVTDWLPWLTPRAGSDREWTTPDIGEQVLVISNGDPSQGAIVGSAFSTASPANGTDGDTRRITFGDGTVVEFNRATSALNVAVLAAGSVRLNIGGSTLLLQDAQVTLTTPKLVVNSPDTTFNGNVSVIGGEVTVDGIGVKGHHHIEHDGPSTGHAQA